MPRAAHSAVVPAVLDRVEHDARSRCDRGAHEHTGPVNRGKGRDRADIDDHAGRFAHMHRPHRAFATRSLPKPRGWSILILRPVRTPLETWSAGRLVSSDNARERMGRILGTTEHCTIPSICAGSTPKRENTFLSSKAYCSPVLRSSVAIEATNFKSSPSKPPASFDMAISDIQCDEHRDPSFRGRLPRSLYAKMRRRCKTFLALGGRGQGARHTARSVGRRWRDSSPQRGIFCADLPEHIEFFA